MTRTHLIFGCALALVALIAFLILRNRNRSAASKINLDELLLDDKGHVSKAAFVMLGSFIVTSWVVAFQALTDHLTDVTFGAYCAAWVAPTITNILNQPGTAVTNTTNVTAEQVSIKPQN